VVAASAGTRCQLVEDFFDGAGEGDGFVGGDLDSPFEVWGGVVCIGEGRRWVRGGEDLEKGWVSSHLSRPSRCVCGRRAGRWLETYTHGEEGGGERGELHLEQECCSEVAVEIVGETDPVRCLRMRMRVKEGS
jgi:hypothetical protein